MKVFGCKRTGGYSGGLIIAAANNLNEAFETFAENYRYRWMTSVYPRSDWFEIPELTANVDTPRIIDEDGYTE